MKFWRLYGISCKKVEKMGLFTKFFGKFAVMKDVLLRGIVEIH